MSLFGVIAASGSGSARVALTNRTVSAVGVDNPQTASFQLNNNGTTTPSATGQWMLTGSASDYQCQATLASGTLSSGTVGSWLGLGTTRTWTRQSSGSLQTATITLDIRDAITSEVLVSGVSVGLEAEVIS